MAAIAEAKRAAALSLGATIVVVAVKLVAAYWSGAISVLSEALQSTVDIAMSAVALAAVAYASKPPDETHPYGHGKAEMLAGAFQMLVIMGTGAFILIQAFERFQHPEPIQWSIGAAAMAYTLASNLLVSRYLRKVVAKTSSTGLESEAMHLAGDSLMAAGVLVGMVLVGLTGQVVLDPVLAIVATLWGIGLAVKQLSQLIHPLMDGSLPAGQVANLEQVLNGHSSVRGYHNLRTRSVGSARFIDLHVLLDDDLSFVAAHDEAERIEDELRGVLGGAIVSIHYEPYAAETEHRRTYHRGE